MRYFLLAALALMLVACRDDGRCAGLPGGGQYCLQPSTAATTFSVQQKVEARFGARADTMIAAIETNAAGMQFVGLTPFGQKFLHVEFDNTRVRALQSPTDKLSPALLLATLQLALWPVAAVERGLDGKYMVTDSATGRLVADPEGQVLARIEHDPGPPPYRRLRVIIPALDLQLDMQNLEAQ